MELAMNVTYNRYRRTDWLNIGLFNKDLFDFVTKNA